jgi:D-alanyl-D-alanine carboxypeptidase
MKSSLLFLLFFLPTLVFSQIISKAELIGKFNPAKHKDFVEIEKKYTTKDDLYLRASAYEALKELSAEAAKAGIKLVVLSATRNFEHQKGIWERKWLRDMYKNQTTPAICKDIMKYSAMPGASRHHWGTDVDFNSLSPEYFETPAGKKLYAWLVENAPNFGFYQPYTSKSAGRTGYEEEKWHWTYLPLSKTYLAEYNKQVNYTDIKGFSGSEAAQEIRAFEDYVNGINPECK